MYRMHVTKMAVLLSGLLLTGITRAEEESETTKAKSANPAGSWKWDYNINDNRAEFQLKLAWDGKKLQGKYTAFDRTTDIEKVKLEQDALSFVVRREYNGNEFVVHFNGKMKLDDIVGAVDVDFGDGSREFDWHAKRFVDFDDVVGVWQLRLETPNRVIEPKVTITKQGDKLHGKYVSRFGEREAKHVTLKDNELSWEISSDDDDDFDFKMVYRGKPRGNTIEGASEFDFGGNTGTMEFDGKRTPPKKAEKETAAEKETDEEEEDETEKETADE